ncbi:hypothetical protein BV25DRAFT_354836 [Artomyces pyxidatus]|uniref:Uncharacterized protein n=1 Tax=Artomyces pyxidatus TaxID=48021 RepID=A0ACB8T4W1_9AGAM|nr:hypothetical protein BV25DRAFT_354836 [Artomyces pyxidatus]
MMASRAHHLLCSTLYSLHDADAWKAAAIISLIDLFNVSTFTFCSNELTFPATSSGNETLCFGHLEAAVRMSMLIRPRRRPRRYGQRWTGGVSLSSKLTRLLAQPRPRAAGQNLTRVRTAIQRMPAVPHGHPIAGPILLYITSKAASRFSPSYNTHADIISSEQESHKAYMWERERGAYGERYVERTS